jgi:hypothetical protein
MPARHILLHLLAPDVKCPTCGSDLVFVRVRGNCDLYHWRATRTWGWAVINHDGAFGEWTACDMPAAKVELFCGYR